MLQHQITIDPQCYNWFQAPLRSLRQAPAVFEDTLRLFHAFHVTCFPRSSLSLSFSLVAEIGGAVLGRYIDSRNKPLGLRRTSEKMHDETHFRDVSTEQQHPRSTKNTPMQDPPIYIRIAIAHVRRVCDDDGARLATRVASDLPFVRMFVVWKHGMS